MSQSKSFWDHPVEVLEEALSIRKQMNMLQKKLSGLFGSESQPSGASRGRGGRRTFSAEARAKMAAAQKARWAQRKGAVSTGPRTRRRKRTMSPEARERIAAAQRARWAKVKGLAGGGATKAASSKGKGKRKRTISAEARAKMAEAARRRWAAVKRKA